MKKTSECINKIKKAWRYEWPSSKYSFHGKEIEVDKYNNLSVLIRPKYERINTLEDAKTGLAIRIGDEFVDRLMSIAIMLNDLKLTNIFEITWLNITEKGNRTRRKTHVEKKHIPNMMKVLKDKPIYQVRITAGKPIK